MECKDCAYHNDSCPYQADQEEEGCACIDYFKPRVDPAPVSDNGNVAYNKLPVMA